MHPQVDIRKIRDRYFNYSVSTGSADERHVREGLRSVAECLHDAATALSHHFTVAVLSYEGRQLGRYRIASMGHPRGRPQPRLSECRHVRRSAGIAWAAAGSAETRRQEGG
jgi:hypothetical protein